MVQNEAIRWNIEDNPYYPAPARIIRIMPQAKDNHLFQIRFVDDRRAHSFDHKPGQFVMLSVPGSGEIPISISSSPTRMGIIELCVRRVGRVTSSVFRLEPNSLVGIRGPYGNGFPIEKMRGNDILIVAGGLGMASLRSLLWYVFDRRSEFDRLIVLYGAKRPDEMLFKEELYPLTTSPDLTCLLTVDADDTGEWKHNIGLLPSLFAHIDVNSRTTYAAVCGPPVIYKYVLEKLLERKFSKDRILMSLERRMKCGIGKCGHCTVGYKYTCLDGPIFTYWDAINLPEII